MHLDRLSIPPGSSASSMALLRRPTRSLRSAASDLRVVRKGTSVGVSWLPLIADLYAEAEAHLRMVVTPWWMR